MTVEERLEEVERKPAPAKRAGEISKAAGGLGLIILAISPLFNWMTFDARGFFGPARDIGISSPMGKHLFGVSGVFVILYAAAVFTRKRLILGAVSLGAAAWGAMSAFLMGGMIWGLANDFDDSSEAFHGIFTTPGAGLYLGLIGGLITLSGLSYLAVQQLGRNRDANE